MTLHSGSSIFLDSPVTFWCYAFVVNATPSVSLTASPHSPAQPRIPVSSLFATLTRTSQKSAKSELVTPLFSSNRFHSSSLLFVTLKQISPVFATLSKSTPGVGGHLSILLKFYFKLRIRQVPLGTKQHRRPTHRYGVRGTRRWEGKSAERRNDGKLTGLCAWTTLVRETIAVGIFSPTKLELR